jgi:hypothetical protein
LQAAKASVSVSEETVDVGEVVPLLAVHHGGFLALSEDREALLAAALQGSPHRPGPLTGGALGLLLDRAFQILESALVLATPQMNLPDSSQRPPTVRIELMDLERSLEISEVEIGRRERTVPRIVWI